jgi:cytochrome c oxidase subunit 4
MADHPTETAAAHLPVEAAHAAAHVDHHNDPEHIRKETRVYILVFVGLAFLTIVTVGVSYLHLPTLQAVALALAIASVKGFLVAGYFMHLLNEKKLVYAVLILTVFFFGVLMWGPWHHRYDAMGQSNQSAPPSQTAAPAQGH